MSIEQSFVTDQIISVVITVLLGIFAYAAFRMANNNRDRYDRYGD